MSSRRNFLASAAAGFIGAIAGYVIGRGNKSVPTPKNTEALTSFDYTTLNAFKEGQILSTWSHGIPANEAAWSVMSGGGNAIDAVEAAARIVELDETGGSVGLGGMPDREGIVTLDACIMDGNGNAGSVTALENYLHPITAARRVMDNTPHVMLTGEGAEAFAESEGLERAKLLTKAGEEAWKKWLVESKYKPIINIENHDTIGIIAQDMNGELAGACTTSGLAFKMRGRVGDSPIIGAGLFVDGDVGAATATGLGEAVMKTCGSFLIVELMRQGFHPQEACEEAVNRIAAKQDYKDFQIGYIAIRKDGEVGAYAIHPGFNYAHQRGENNKMVDVGSLIS